MTTKQDLASGAKRVEELDHLQSGLETPGDLATGDRHLEDNLTAGQSDTPLGAVVLSMLQKPTTVQVRVGSPTNSSELYEGVYDSADEANTALLDAGVLTQEQVPDINAVAGAGLKLGQLTSQQLENAGLKRKSNPTI